MFPNITRVRIQEWNQVKSRAEIFKKSKTQKYKKPFVSHKGKQSQHNQLVAKSIAIDNRPKIED